MNEKVSTFSTKFNTFMKILRKIGLMSMNIEMRKMQKAHIFD